MIGTTLSHYKIVAEIGRGGMGIVYKAEDTKLNRTVAIKVLPVAALGNADDKARFFREAQAAAQLHHANIATVFAIEESTADDGTKQPFIAMEFIDGETLTERIAAGPIKLDETIEITMQVANALELAHEKNIVHRDVKSGNVMMTSRGVAKVLDFGLAKTAQSTKLTQLGSTLGTIAYMSPEQARGEEVDHRADIWALGVLIYEMISGRLPFASEYEQAAVYSILNEDPEPLTALRTGVPMELESVVSKALRKDAKLRYQSLADMIADLSALNIQSLSATRHSSASLPKTAPTEQPSPRASVLTLTAVGIVAVLIGFLLSRVLFPTTPSQDPLDMSLRLPGLDALISSEPATAADLLTLSPDGMKVAYVGISPEAGLFVKDLTTGEKARKIASRAETPAFSPDSRSIAYASDGYLYRAGLQGDAPQVVTDGVTDIVGLYWARDGYLYYAADYATGLSRVSAEGGDAETLTTPDPEQGEIGHVYPQMMPDGETIVFTSYSPQGYELRILDVPSGRIGNLGPGVTPHFIEPDILIYAQGPRLLAARLDQENVQLGPPVVLSEAIYHNITSFSSNIGVSHDGDVLFIDGASTWNVPLEVRRWDGSTETVAPEVPDINQYSFSRDGRYIVLAGHGAVTDPDIWLYDLQTRDTRQVTTNPLYDAAPRFSSDGSTIWFSSERDGISDIFALDPVSGDIEVVFRDATPKYLSSVAPDDSFLLYSSSSDLWVLDMTGELKTSLLAENLLDEQQSDVSPNSRWIAYASEETGQGEIFVIDYPSTRPRQRITVGGGQAPIWSEDGQFLYYKQASELFRVAMNENGERVGEPVRVMEGIYDQFELIPDGSGVLVRATPPRRMARYIQNAINGIEARLDVQ